MDMQNVSLLSLLKKEEKAIQDIACAKSGIEFWEDSEREYPDWDQMVLHYKNEVSKAEKELSAARYEIQQYFRFMGIRQ